MGRVHRHKTQDFCSLVFIILLTAAVQSSAESVRDISPEADTAYLPIASSMWGTDASVYGKAPVATAVRVVKVAEGDSAIGSYVIVNNASSQSNVPAQIVWNRWPQEDIIDEQPIRLDVSDLAIMADSSMQSVLIVGFGFREDSLFAFNFVFPNGKVIFQFLATGKDLSGDGKWTGTCSHLLTDDIDGDSNMEMLFYLQTDRDLNPRTLFCIDPLSLRVKWSLPVASPIRKLYSCANSPEGGVLFVTGNPGHGSKDSLFSDDVGYLVRLDGAGHILLSRQVSTYPIAANLLRAFSTKEFLLIQHRGPTRLKKTVDSVCITLISESGEELKTVVDSGRADEAWIGQYGADEMPKLQLCYRNGKLKILSNELRIETIIDGADFNGNLAHLERFDGQHPAYVLGLKTGGAGIFNSSFEQLASFNFMGDKWSVVERNTAGEVTAIVGSDHTGAYQFVRLTRRGWQDLLAIFYRRNQLYFLSGMFGLIVGIMVTNFYRYRTKKNLLLIDKQRMELQRVHEELKQAQATIVAQEKYRQAKDIAGGFAHEIKNALFPADGALIKQERLLTDPSPDSERLKATNQTIRSAMARAINLTRLITTYTKLDSEVEREPADFNAVLDDVLRANKAPTEDRRIAIEKRGPSDIRTPLNAEHLRSVLNNLLVNSIDALGSRTSPTINIVWRVDGDILKIDWSDSGCGIAEADLPRVFDAFFSTKPTTGTGLGLSIVKKIIELYDGSISVDSRIGEGATFHLELPTLVKEGNRTV